VPKIPSYRIVDVAKAIAPDAELEVVGIRPGEKLHEEMVTETDALNTIEFDSYYVILPATRLWDPEEFRLRSNERPGRFCDYGFRYSSGTNSRFLSVDELRELIEKHVEKNLFIRPTAGR
jgi:FlaA1/EpsC-like NDP-sugar epimerase